MKNTASYFFICILILSFSHSKAEGMQFFEGSWKEVLEKAKAQNKPIFIDVYTVWCGPCKQMSKNIFPLDKVGKKYNSLFINYKIDAEQGEGITIAKKYGVDAYPTYLFVDANENLFYKSVGSMPVDRFIAEADLAIAELKEDKPLRIWDKEYAEGKREADFLRNYMQKRNKIRMNNAEILEEYIKTQSEEALSSEENLLLIMENINSIEGKGFEILMKNREKIESAQMRMDRRFLNFRMRIPEAIKNTAAKAIKHQDMTLLEKCVETNKQFYNTFMTSRFAEKYNAELYMKYYKEGKDKEKYLKIAIDYIEKYVMSKSVESIKKIDEGNYERFMQIYRMGMADSTKDEKFEEMKTLSQKMESRSTAAELNNAAGVVVEFFDDKETLAKVAPWLERALTLIREPHILDNQAHLLFKLGKKKEAITTQKEAISLAQKQGIEVEKYEKFLAEMQK